MKRKQWGILVVAFALVLLFAACGKKKAPASDEAAPASESSKAQETSETVMSIRHGTITLAKPGFDKKIKDLQKRNADVVGWISLDGTPNAYPLLYSGDNDYYLRRNIDKEYELYGIPFLDMENTSKLTDQNTVIYGHMPDAGGLQQFGVLRHYKEQEFTDKSPKTVTITTNNGIYTYRLFTIHKVLEEAPYRRANMPEKEYAALLKEAVEGSMVNFHYDKAVTTKERVLTLSTCTGDGDHTYRLAILGVLDKAELTPEAFEEAKRFYGNEKEKAPEESSTTQSL